jgi:NADH pyrophosphatase NudC (nudix superfamily)
MNEQELEQKLIAAYDKMMSRINALLNSAEQQALPVLQSNIEKAKQQAVELKELSKDEAEKLAYYLQRDIHDAAEYLEETGEKFSTWFNFDVELIEERLMDAFQNVADKTRIELAQLAAQAKRAQQYHTGEITTIGTLSCQECGTKMHFKKTSRIPPCPKCHTTAFIRSSSK